MPQYFLHLRNDTDELIDEDGTEAATIADVRALVRRAVLDLICGDVMGGEIDLRHRIDAEDEQGVIAYTLRFSDAVTIIR